MNIKKYQRRYWEGVLLVPLILLIIASPVRAQMTSQNFQIRTFVLDSGGGRESSVSYGLRNSTGQSTPIGISRSSTYGIFAGFQAATLENYVFPILQNGDVTGDGQINVLDVMAVVNHILGTVPITDPAALKRADCNGDGKVNILDALGIVNVILGIGQCVPGACKIDLTPKTIEFLRALEPLFSPEDYAEFMSLVKKVEVPTEHSLSQNYPNPFNPSTDIRYQIPDRRSKVHTTLKIYNMLGQEVRTLVDEPKTAGYYTVTWDSKDNEGRQVASGIYFYRFTAGDFTATKRMVLMK